MAADSSKKNEATGNLILEGRERLSISGVEDVISFDENEILAETVLGTLVTRGEELHVERLSLDTGELIINGRLDSFEYLGDGRNRGCFWSKLF
ncbi:MAG: sporulation protein YabP [Clostridia bacterium]|nr:sporulation protein YabP [Clostridia bacterium]